MRRRLRDKLITLAIKLSPLNAVATKAFAPVYLTQIKIICPDCGSWGTWPVPEGFRIAITDKILVICENGHNWGISGAYERITIDSK